MGVELVEGRDLVVMNGHVMMRTTKGFERVDVIYRRIDDDFWIRRPSGPIPCWACPASWTCTAPAASTLANAPGTGIADDKVVYAYVPKIIRYYLGEDAILPNVPTFVCWDDASASTSCENLDKFVVKAANESGGYGMLVGPHSTAEQREKFRHAITADPRNYIAQPTLVALASSGDRRRSFRRTSRGPSALYVYTERRSLFTRRTDARCIKKGSLVVNSSQGGGSKDTWVLSC